MGMHLRRWAVGLLAGGLVACGPGRPSEDAGTRQEPVDGGSVDGGAPADMRPPPMPHSLSVQVELGAATLSWEPSPEEEGAPVQGYMVRVVRKGLSGTELVAQLELPAEARTTHVTGLRPLSPSDRFVFWLVAVNPAGFSPALMTLSTVVPAPVAVQATLAPLPGGTCARLDVQLSFERPVTLTLEAEVLDPVTQTYRPATLGSPDAAPRELSVGPIPITVSLLWHHTLDVPADRSAATLRLRVHGGDVHYGELVLTPTRAELTSLPFAALPLELPTGERARKVRVADFDGDGRLDIATANEQTQNVSLVLQGADGGFDPRVRTVALGVPVDALWAGDLDGDGRQDLVAGSSQDPRLFVLRGRGDGTLLPVMHVPAGGWVSALEGADVDGDGHVDLLALDAWGGLLRLLRGRADGTLAPPVEVATLPGAGWLAVSDFDGDGLRDVVLAALGPEGALLFAAGDGTGAFHPTPPVRVPTLRGVGQGDLDGDGRPEVLTASAPAGDDAGTVEAHTFGAAGVSAQRTLLESRSYFSRHLDVGDLNADGRADLVLSSWPEDITGAGAVSVLLAEPDGSLTWSQGISLDSALSTLLVDVDGDGALDLLSAGTERGLYATQLSVLWGRGDGLFQFRDAPGAQPDVEADVADILPADIDGDGRMDLLVAHRTLGLRLGLGNGTFQPEQESLLPSRPRALAAADFVPGGGLDVVAMDELKDVYLLSPQADGALGAPTRIGSLPSAVGPLQVADFNGDGTPDLAARQPDGRGPVLLLSSADGSFHTVEPRPGWGALDALLSGDVNGDGNVDLVPTSSQSSVPLLLGVGDGTFVDAHGVGSEGIGQVLVDITGDGRLDLLTSKCMLLPGNAQGLSPAYSIFPSSSCEVLGTGDWDRDGRRDLLMQTAQGSPGQPWLNTGHGTFVQFHLWPPVPMVARAQSADFNGDGFEDVALVLHDSVDELRADGLQVLLSGRCMTCTAGAVPGRSGTCEP